MNTQLNQIISHRAVQMAGVVLAILASLWVAQWSVVFGASRLFVRYALGMRDQVVANEAVRMTPFDAEAHYASAVVSGWYNPTPHDAVIAMEKAVAVRPLDYTMWMQLGLFRDQVGDVNGARAAFDEAIRLAPFYAKPRWLRGNVLLRAGQTDQGIDDLRQAVASDPELTSAFVDLAWGLSKGDPKLTEQIVGTDNPRTHLTLARLLARHSKPKEAAEHFRLANSLEPEARRQFINDLLAKESFGEAYAIWRGANSPSSTQPEVYDGGFEGSLNYEEDAFGWRFPRNSVMTPALDTENPKSGEKSLRLSFKGDFSPGHFAVSQLIVVEPSKRYRINFASRSDEVVTGGLPTIVIQEASTGRKVLGQSKPLASGSVNWLPYSFEFTSLPTTTAVVLSLQRQPCTVAPCPIFGSILLDSFSIERLN